MASIKIKNVTDYARDGLVTVGIPFSKEDNVRPGDFFVVNGANATTNQHVQWYPEGATYDNGAVKYVRAHFKTSLTANQERTATVTKSGSRGTTSIFNYVPFLFGLANTTFKFRIRALGGAQGLTPVSHEETFSVGSANPDNGWAVSIEGDTSSSSIDHINTYKFFRRLNTTDPYLSHVWIQLVVEFGSGLPYCQFYFRYGFFKYRPTFPNISPGIIRNRDGSNRIAYYNNGVPVYEQGFVGYESGAIEPSLWLDRTAGTTCVELEIANCRSRIRAEQWKVEEIVDFPSPSLGRTYRLINPTRFGTGADGSGQAQIQLGGSHCYKGVLCFDTSDTCLAELQNFTPVGTSSVDSNTSFNITKVGARPAANEIFIPSSQILAMAEDWKNFYPATNCQPPRPPYVTSDLNYFQRSSNVLATLLKSGAARASAKQAYNHAYLGPNLDTTDAGEHGTRTYAYGLRGFPTMQTTNYYWLPLLEYNTRQESVRSNWFLGDGTEGQPIGEPIPPNLFRNGPTSSPFTLLSSGGGVTALWNGTFFGTGNYRLGGYTRQAQTRDAVFAEGNKRSWGPDKEHMTNNIIIIQALISMDWFGREYARAQAKHFISSHRTDNAPVGSNSQALTSWGVARAVGRVSEMGAFLYEMTGDEELRGWLRQRHIDNIGPINGNDINSAAGLLKFNTGGLERIRCAVNNWPSDQGAGCTNQQGGAQRHWRPWEEGETVLGFYVLAKCLLSKDPADPVGLQMLNYSRDVAGCIVINGIQDLRGGTAAGESSPRINREVNLMFQGATGRQDRWNFMKQIVPLIPVTINGYARNVTDRLAFVENRVNVSVRGRTSNASGRVRLMAFEGEYSWNNNLQLWLTDASGDFINGEIVEIVGNTSFTAQIYISRELQGYKCKATQAPSGFPALANGFGFDLTQAEEDAQAIGQLGGFNHEYLAEEPQEIPANGTPAQGSTYGSGWQGFGYFRHTRYYYVYESVISAAFSVAKEAASLGYYQNSAAYPNANATMLLRAQSVADSVASRWGQPFFNSSQIANDYSQDINERFACFADYLNRSLYQAGPSIATPAAQTCFTSIPTPTVTVTNQQFSSFVNVDSTSAALQIPEPSVNTISSESVIVRPSNVAVTIDNTPRHSTRIGTQKLPSAVSAFTEVPTIAGVILTSVFPGKRVTTVIEMGLPYVEPSFTPGPDSGPDPSYKDFHENRSSYFDELDRNEKGISYDDYYNINTDAYEV